VLDGLLDVYRGVIVGARTEAPAQPTSEEVIA